MFSGTITKKNRQWVCTHAEMGIILVSMGEHKSVIETHESCWKKLIMDGIINRMDLLDNKLFVRISVFELIIQQQFNILKRWLRQTEEDFASLAIKPMKHWFLRNLIEEALRGLEEYWRHVKVIDEQGVTLLAFEALVLGKKPRSYNRFKSGMKVDRRVSPLDLALLCHSGFEEKTLVEKYLRLAFRNTNSSLGMALIASAWMGLRNNETIAVRCINQAEKLAHMPAHWQICAEIWDEVFNKPVERDRCLFLASYCQSQTFLFPQSPTEKIRDLDKGEENAGSTTDWINCAEGWRETFGGSIRAASCLKKAEDHAFDTNRWVALAKAWDSMPGGEKQKESCLIKAKSRIIEQFDASKFESVLSSLSDKSSLEGKNGDNFFSSECQHTKSAVRSIASPLYYIDREYLSFQKSRVRYLGLQEALSGYYTLLEKRNILDSCVSNSFVLEKGSLVALVSIDDLGLLYRHGYIRELYRLIQILPLFIQDRIEILCWYHFLRGDINRAKDSFNQLLEKENPSLNQYFFALCCLKDQKTARKILKQISYSDHENNLVLIQCAKIWWLDQNNFQLASQCIEQAKEFNEPADLCRLAEVHLLLKHNFVITQEYLTKAESEASQAFHYALCATFRITLFNDRIGAIDCMKKAVRIAGNTWEMIELGKIYRVLLNDERKALDCYKRAEILICDKLDQLLFESAKGELTIQSYNMK